MFSLDSKITSLALDTGLTIVLVIGRVKVLLDIVDHLTIWVMTVGLVRVLHVLAPRCQSYILWLAILTALEDLHFHI